MTVERTIDLTEIYIADIYYADYQWVDDPDSLLEDVRNNLFEISGFDFVTISLDLSNTFHTGNDDNFISNTMYMKGCIYNQRKFIPEVEMIELASEIDLKLSSIDNFFYKDIIFRTERNFIKFRGPYNELTV